MQSSDAQIMSRLGRVINKVLFLKKQSLFQFRGVAFYPAEVHLLLIVRDGTAANATRMADQLGITKGAVSQTLTRLEHKGVLTKTRDSANKNELTLAFTDFGARAFEHYSGRVAALRERHARRLAGFTADEQAVILRFLNEAEQMVDDIR